MDSVFCTMRILSEKTPFYIWNAWYYLVAKPPAQQRLPGPSARFYLNMATPWPQKLNSCRKSGC